jgi:hypothetical protein
MINRKSCHSMELARCHVASHSANLVGSGSGWIRNFFDSDTVRIWIRNVLSVFWSWIQPILTCNFQIWPWTVGVKISSSFSKDGVYSFFKTMYAPKLFLFPSLLLTERLYPFIYIRTYVRVWTYEYSCVYPYIRMYSARIEWDTPVIYH